MIKKQCDLCNGDAYKTYNIDLIDGDKDIILKGRIDLCDKCANKIKESISGITTEND